MVKVSVIIPTFGIPLYLKKTIDSVLQQTLVDFQLIVIDDNNPNTKARAQTQNLVKSYVDKDNRVCYFQHEFNKNGAAARNSGLSIATGKYISFLDSDDEYMPNRLQLCYDAMEHSSNDVAGVYTGCEFRKKGRSYLKYLEVKSGNFLIETLACKFMFCTGSNIFVRKSVVEELNGFDETFIRHQDYEFLVRVFEKYSLLAIPKLLVIKNNENLNLPSPENLIEIKKQYISKYKYIIDHLSRQEVNYIMHSNLINIAECAMNKNNIRIANSFYQKANEYGCLTYKEWFRRIAFPFYNVFRKYV